MGSSMRDAGGAVLVDQIAVDEAVEGERLVQLVRPVLGQGIGEHPAGAGRGLEAAGAPAAVEIEALNRRLADDRAGIRADIDDAAPGAQHAQAAEDRKQLDQRVQQILDDGRAAGLGIGIVAVDAGAHDQLALVGLADIDMDGARHDDGVEHRLDRLADQRLERMAFEGKAQSRHGREHAGMASGDAATFFAPMKPFDVSTPRTRPWSMRKPVTSQFWMMSMPRLSAARAKPHATASWRATPPRRCSEAPR